MDLKKYLNNAKDKSAKLIGRKEKEAETTQRESRNYFNLNQEEDVKSGKSSAKERKSAPAAGSGKPGRRSNRKRMSKTEKRIRIAINWTLFAVAVILAVVIIIKLITGAVHLITGSSKKEEVKEEAPAAAEATTEIVVEEKKPTGPVEITISAIGDCVLGTDETFGYEGGFTERYDTENNPAYFFEKVKPVLEADDLTIANLEVALTKSLNMSDHEYNFKGEPEYAKILSEGSVEAANLANTHTHDYGEDGYNDTIEFAEQAGVRTFGNERTAIVTIKGVKIGLIGVDAEEDDLAAYTEQVQTQISNVKLEGAQIVIVSCHWGIESESSITEMQKTLGHAAIDAGADLVIGHHPHVLQGIEEYQGKNIVYSLGNFVYGANSSPSDYKTMIYQQTFTVNGDDVSSELVTNIVPCLISSSDELNNYQPMLAEGDVATRIQDLLSELSQEVLNVGTTASEENADSEESYNEESEGSQESYDESEIAEEPTEESYE